MSNQILLPRVFQFGAGASNQIASVLKDIGASRPLLVTDQMMVALGYAEKIVDNITQAGMSVEVFSKTLPEPTSASIDAGVAMVASGRFDSILALGGGSAIDSAKAMAILGKFGGRMRDYKAPRVVNEQGLPLIAIPTTAGTGSEATRFTIITDETNDEKMLCMGAGFMPVAALVDYELSMSVPPRTTVDTGIDALTHAIEAYVSVKANPYSDSQAIAAMRLLASNLSRVFRNGDDAKAREEMMLGSTLAGVAFSNASVALVHGMSRPIGAFFHVPHGLSNAMLLPSVTKYSIPGAPERYAECAVYMGFAGANDSNEVANQKLVNKLEQLNNELEVPSLAEFGVGKAKFDQVKEILVEQAFASGSPVNNPLVPGRQEMLELYEGLWV